MIKRTKIGDVSETMIGGWGLGISLWASFKLRLMGAEPAKLLMADFMSSAKAAREEESITIPAEFMRDLERMSHHHWSMSIQIMVKGSKVNVDRSLTIPAPLAIRLAKIASDSFDRLSPEEQSVFQDQAMEIRDRIKTGLGIIIDE